MRLTTWAVSALPSIFAGSITQKHKNRPNRASSAKRGKVKPHTGACTLWATALKTLTGAHLLPLGEEWRAGLDDIFGNRTVVVRASTPAQLHGGIFYVPHHQPPRRPWRTYQKENNSNRNKNISLKMCIINAKCNIHGVDFCQSYLNSVKLCSCSLIFMAALRMNPFNYLSQNSRAC